MWYFSPDEPLKAFPHSEQRYGLSVGKCLKALPDHSFMCHFPECTTFTGPHDNRLVGTQRKERDACQSGYILARPEGDRSVHDTSVTGHRETLSLPPPPFSQG